MNRARRIIRFIRSIPQILRRLEAVIDEPEARELTNISDIVVFGLVCFMAGGIVIGAIGQIALHRF